MESKITRQFVHDLANNFSILDASITKAIVEINRIHPELEREVKSLKKADEYMKKSIQILKEFRDYVRDQEK
jgi:large-conductance mechanosensitive channel